ncbi:MAG: protein kinase domain-containing protein [Methylococcaceae bacterium]
MNETRKLKKNHQQDMEVLLGAIRGGLVTGDLVNVKETISQLFDSEISQVYLTLFQQQRKPLRWGARKHNLEETLQRIVLKLRDHSRFSEFAVDESQHCRIMFEMVTIESACNIRNLTSLRVSKNRYEAGVNGLKYKYQGVTRFFMPTDAVTQSVMSVSQLLNFLSKQTGIAKQTNKISERVNLMRREPIEYTFIQSMAYITYQKKTIPLYRGYPIPETFNRSVIYDSMIKSIDWLVENMNVDGSFLYFYDGIKDTKVDLDHPKMVDPLYNNILRHSGGTVTLLRGYELTKNPTYLDAAKKSIDFFLTTFKQHKHQGQYACYPFFNKKSKLGGAGIGLVAMMHYYMHTGDECYRKQLDGLTRHILSRIDEEGEMLGYYIHPNFNGGKAIINPPDDVKKELFSFYYPGEALLGLALYYQNIKNIDPQLETEIYQQSLKALDFLVDVRPVKYDYLFDSLPADAWLMQAIEAWVKVEGFKKQSYIDFVFNDTQAMSDHMYTEENAIAPDYVGGFFYSYGDHVYHDASRNEGVIAAYYLAKYLADEQRASSIMSNMFKSAAGLMHTFHTPESTYAHKYPKKSIDSFRFKLTRQWVRVDSVQHAACFFARLVMTEFDQQTTDETKTEESVEEFEIIKKLGKGGFGIVNLVQDKDNKKYALKKIHHSRYINRIEQEERALNVMNEYNNSLTFYSSKTRNEDVYFLFEYASRGNLKRHIDKKGPFDEVKAITFVEAMLNILKYTIQHELLHLDIKPANILLYQDSFWLADWGLSQFGDSVPTIHLKGNPIYLAPEIYRGQRCFASEIYALGCSLYYVVTGKAPFALTNDMPVENKIYLHTYMDVDLSIVMSKKVAYLIARMMDKDPLKRININEIETLLVQSESVFDYETKTESESVADDKIEMLQKMAEDGIAYAQYLIGSVYVSGDLVDQDKKKAAKWYEQAALQGLANGECGLGISWYEGWRGEPDYVKAYEWFFRAAEKEHDKAQYYLGKMYEQGLGVDVDMDKALQWFEKSAKNGYRKSHQCLKNYNRHVTVKLMQ